MCRMAKRSEGSGRPHDRRSLWFSDHGSQRSRETDPREGNAGPSPDKGRDRHMDASAVGRGKTSCPPASERCAHHFVARTIWVIDSLEVRRATRTRQFAVISTLCGHKRGKQNSTPKYSRSTLKIADLDRAARLSAWQQACLLIALDHRVEKRDIRTAPGKKLRSRDGGEDRARPRRARLPICQASIDKPFR